MVFSRINYQFAPTKPDRDLISNLMALWPTEIKDARTMPAAPKPPRIAAQRILVVEDNELNMKLLNDVLEAHGYQVMSTGRGEVAIEWAQQYRPELILMDLQLPDLSGLEATRRLKANAETRDIPVIAVTAFAMAGDEKKALDHGCDAYVAKPIVLRDFLNLIADFIGQAPASWPA
jgi:two-component system, cell cycle response regulator DivK